MVLLNTHCVDCIKGLHLSAITEVWIIYLAHNLNRKWHTKANYTISQVIVWRSPIPVYQVGYTHSHTWHFSIQAPIGNFQDLLLVRLYFGKGALFFGNCACLNPRIFKSGKISIWKKMPKLKIFRFIVNLSILFRYDFFLCAK